MISRQKITALALAVLASAFVLTPRTAPASSHMDAPLVTLDPAANTTDVYAFVTDDGTKKYLTTALAVYPFEEPGIGPNKYNFDDNVLYEIHVVTGNGLATGRATHTFQFRFDTNYKNVNTIAQSYLGVIADVHDLKQNLTQTYTVRRVGVGTGPRGETLFTGKKVPPNNQGLATPLYNQGNNGENKAREGVSTSGALDHYTTQTVFTSPNGYIVFAGQRDDGFYADIQSIFDLDFMFSGANKPFDSQGGFNVHTMVLSIPVTELGGDQQVVGVYATTSRKKVSVLRENGRSELNAGKFVQVGRQGNPLFCEALVAIKDKDLYNKVRPTADAARFQDYALSPELAGLLNAQLGTSAVTTDRTDLAAIFIPDLIKIDLSTSKAKLAGGSNSGAAADDAGFHRLSIFGGDTLTTTLSNSPYAFFGNTVIPGGWPNGRRFGDDVLDIAVLAILSDLRTNPPTVFDPDGAGPLTSADANIDKVTENDIGYNKVFPYAATPQNGRNHDHH
jgi:hypothetical protein